MSAGSSGGLVVLSLLAACGQGAASSVQDATAGDPAGTITIPSDGTVCGTIGAGYHDALMVALACDPAMPDACTEWRPLSVATVGNGGSTADARITGLCFVAGRGYVTPQHTAHLDAIVERYKDAGCKVSFCPGFPNVANRCVQNAAGRFTCGGM